jgi:hypothetical protein
MLDNSSTFKITKRIKIHFIPILLLLTCLIVSCVHAPAPYRPSSWPNTPVDMKSVEDNPNHPLLQVILVYGPWWCHHSALRLVCPDRSVLFWDPGGSYGTPEQTEVRSKDVIRINPPDLEAYLRFTWDYSTVEVEVFEWDLTSDQAHERNRQKSSRWKVLHKDDGGILLRCLERLPASFCEEDDERAEIFLLPSRFSPGSLYTIAQTRARLSPR